MAALFVKKDLWSCSMLLFALVTCSLLLHTHAVNIELTLDAPGGQYFLDGYSSHEQFFSTLLQLLGSRVKSATENFLAHSNADIGQLLPNINAKEYTILQFLHSLATSDSMYANLLIQFCVNGSLTSLISDEGYTTGSVMGELVRSSLSYPPATMYKVANSIVNGRRYGFNDIPLMMTNEVLSLLNKSAVFIEASKKGNIDMMKMFFQSATKLDLSKALEFAWRHKQKEVVKMLINNNATIRNTDVIKKTNSDNESILHLAVEAKSPQFVEVLLEASMPVNSLDRDGFSPLYKAVLNNNMEIAQMLIKNGALVNLENKLGYIPIHEAASNGNLEMVKLLLESGSTVDKVGKYGVTPLLICEKKTVMGIIKYLFEKDLIKPTESNRNLTLFYWMSFNQDEGSFSISEHDREVENILNNSEIVNALLMRGGKPFIGVDIKSKLLTITLQNGINLLPQSLLNIGARLSLDLNETKEMFFTVIKLGNQELITFLLNEGMSSRAMRGDGTTPLHAAASSSSSSSVDIFHLLLKRGANLNAVTQTGYSVLHAACEGGQVALVEYLLQRGLSINLKDNRKNTPLFVAAKHGHFSVIKFLIQKGANIKSINIENQTCLHAAAIGGNIKAINLMIDKGADIEAKAKHGETPLFEAAQSGKLSAVKTLLERGANIETNNTSGVTLLDITIYKNHLDVLEFLLDRGMNPDNKNRFGWSPLHLAAANDRVEAAKLLLNRGVFIEAQGKWGDTALHLAVKSGSVNMVTLLLQRRHKIGIRNKEGKTPFDMAIEKCEKQMIKFFIEHGGNASLPIDPKCLE